MYASHEPYAMLSERSRGWLKYLHRKANTPDNWDREGHPSPMWDGKSSPPMLSFPRFDLLDSSYAMALMADTTPAWREIYSSILDQLLERYGTYWGAIDWMTQIGHDPQRENYPESWKRLYIPDDLQGQYDVPGWTANGIEPWGLQMDPIGADGNLFYKGFFDLMLGLYRYVSGDDKWNRPFTIIRDGPNTFTYTHSAINDLLTRQWAARREGCHCENTKIWPY
jgi:Linalool dehydratase/isomerase